jgi:hypothetical protein
MKRQWHNKKSAAIAALFISALHFSLYNSAQ